ncbi:unnamed protein product [Owenia fusiformis]|uniref:N(6)-L-threonylcarbamoyladenine synthase n=1 Tax=Owenia fusiformis TaxID=6347 RepID=A0A8J1XRR9_OWEFU|nr:unnamed protein product [Owenia fusiformis]
MNIILQLSRKTFNTCIRKRLLLRHLQNEQGERSLKQYCSIHTSVTLYCKTYILGIETSCDDTGAAVVDNGGNILGEALNSQTDIHVQLGGIIPPVARDLHRQNIDDVVKLAMDRAKLKYEELNAIAVTVKPGLALSLAVGINYAKDLALKFRKPLIPIHHMEAHALTPRIETRIDFPYLVLLASGGHCLLAAAQGVDQFKLIGKGQDNSPGEAFDKIARRLKLITLPGMQGLSGGAAIEQLAQRGDPKSIEFPNSLSKHPNCNFSFAGLQTQANYFIAEIEKQNDIKGPEVIPGVADFCASFQYAITRHICQRVQRGLIYSDMKELITTDKKQMVLSGGVGSNMFVRRSLEKVCKHYNFELVCPPPKLCTDNGVMIAWNGMERLNANCGVLEDESAIKLVDLEHRAPLGMDITQDVTEAGIKIRSSSKVKLL